MSHMGATEPIYFVDSLHVINKWNSLHVSSLVHFGKVLPHMDELKKTFLRKIRTAK